jgi:hypothetical protein
LTASLNCPEVGVIVLLSRYNASTPRPITTPLIGIHSTCLPAVMNYMTAVQATCPFKGRCPIYSAFQVQATRPLTPHRFTMANEKVRCSILGLSNVVQRSSSWEANSSHLVKNLSPALVHHSVNSRPPLISVLSQMNPIYTLTFSRST